ncbi:unnamed protein product, partial [Didymodactylos carnosus]
MIRFNLFRNKSRDTNDIKYQRLSTRLYVLILSITLVILAVYSGLSQQIKLIIVQSPSLSTYEELESKYSDTLICPCSQLSINYKSFLSFEPSYHQVCRSAFITQEWIDSLSLPFGLSLSPQFQALRSFCQRSKDTIGDALDQLYSSVFISSKVIPSTLWITQQQSFVNEFQAQTPNVLMKPFDLIRDMTYANQLVTFSESNWAYTVTWYHDTFDELYPYAMVTPVTYTNDNETCSCFASPKCKTPFQSDTDTIDQFFTGCYPMEALLQSSLVCFYSQMCLDKFLTLVRIQATIWNVPIQATTLNVTILNSTLLSNYFITSTVEDIVRRLMVEQWNAKLVYESYYQECAPASCSYTYMRKLDIVHMITATLGLFGGLTIAFQIIIPFVVLIVRIAVKQLNRHKIAPTFILVQEYEQRCLAPPV